MNKKIDATKPENYKLENGWEIVSIFTNPDGNLFVIYEHPNGSFGSTLTDSSGSNIYDNGPYDIIKREFYENFKNGDPVIVWNTGGEEERRYFSHVDNDGMIFTYSAGRTEWSSKKEIVKWKFCRHPTKEEFKS